MSARADVVEASRERSGAGFAGALAGAYLLLTAVGIAIGLLVVHLLDHSRIGRADAYVNEVLASRRVDFLDHLTRVTSAVGDTYAIVAVALVVAVVARVVTGSWRPLAILATGLVLEVASFVTMAGVVGRSRPDVARLDQAPPTSSFPSGHTAAAVVLYGALAVFVVSHSRRPGLRIAAIVLAVLVPAVVGAGRLYRGMHHPTDVLAGALLGLAALAVALRLAGPPPGREEPSRKGIE